MALCAMLVGGNALHRRCRQAGALLWMMRSLTIALGLPHGKQIKHPSACLRGAFYPALILPPNFKAQKNAHVFGNLQCCGLDAPQKADLRRTVFNKVLFVCCSPLLLSSSLSMPASAFSTLLPFKQESQRLLYTDNTWLVKHLQKSQFKNATYKIQSINIYYQTNFSFVKTSESEVPLPPRCFIWHYWAVHVNKAALVSSRPTRRTPQLIIMFRQWHCSGNEAPTLRFPQWLTLRCHNLPS